MIEMACPKCGRGGSVPREKAHSRLVCKVCHSVFHMGPAGRPVLGEPLTEGAATTHAAAPGVTAARPKADAATLSLGDLTGGGAAKPLLLVLALLVAVGGSGMLWSAYTSLTTDSLETRAKAVGQALADSDMKRLQTLALEGSAEGLAQWHDKVRPSLEEIKAVSRGGRLVVGVMVMSESRDLGAGTASVLFAPAGDSQQTEQIAEAVGTTAKARGFLCHWVVGPGGHWVLNVPKTLEDTVVVR